MKIIKNSIVKNLHSFQFAVRGLGFIIRHENNIKYQILAGIIVVIAGVYFGLNLMEWVAITIAIGLVLMAESFNTAIEVLLDIVHPDYHKKVGLVKDISAGAVLLISIAAAIIGVIIFGPKLIAQINGTQMFQ